LPVLFVDCILQSSTILRPSSIYVIGQKGDGIAAIELDHQPPDLRGSILGGV
jgi:hypothetical protein